MQSIAFPLIAAALFTAGAYGISRAGPYAGFLTHVLTILSLVLLMLLGLKMMRSVGEVHALASNQVKTASMTPSIAIFPITRPLQSVQAHGMLIVRKPGK